MTLTNGTCQNDFADPIDHNICTQCALSWKIVVSEWWLVIAVLLNVSGGVSLIKQVKLYICIQTHYTHDEDRRTVPDGRSHGSVPLSHSGNLVTRIGSQHTLQGYKLIMQSAGLVVLNRIC